MFVSVIVPVYNGAKTLHRCIDALLAQDFPTGQYEILIVDNGSRDTTWELIASYGPPVRGLRELEIQSSYASRNTGIRASQGELIAFTDSDCIPAPDWLRVLVAAFDDPTVGCAGGRIDGLPPRTRAERYAERRGVLSQEMSLDDDYLPYLATANVVFRRAVLDELGGFEAIWESCGDIDLCWRMLRQTPWQLRYLPEAVVLHHHRTNSGDLWKQFKRYGRGRVNLQMRYPDYKSTPYETLTETFRRCARLGKQAARFAVRAPLRDPAARDDLDFAYYSLLTQAAFALGVREGRARVRKGLSTNRALGRGELARLEGR